MGVIFIWYRRPAAASGSVGTVFSLAAQAGNGTTTLTWSEAGNIDTVDIYRDGVLEDSVAGGTETWTSGALNDGLYTWYLVPVYDSEEGTPSSSKVFGNMSGDVWVDAVNGSDSNNGSSPTLAKKTLRAAGSLVNSAGKRVVVRGGTYSEYNTKDNGGSTYGNAPVTTYTQDGTSENYCEFRSFPGETVIIDGSSITRPLGSGATDPNRPELFSIMGDYWLVAGWPGYPIHIQNSAGCGFRTRLTTGAIVEYVYSHDHEGSAFNMQESDDWIVRNCAGYRVYSTVNDGETADGVEAAGCDNCLVEDCFFAWCGDDGVDFITATNCTVQRTVVYRSNYFAGGTTGNGNGNGFKLAHTSNKNSGNKALNCIAFECEGIGFTFNGGGALAAQCTSIGNRYGFAIGSGTDDGVVSMRENISYNNSTTNMLYNGVSPAVDAYNSWNTPPGVTVTSGDFTTLTFNTAWRSWDEVVSAGFASLDSGSDMKGAGQSGQDLGYEGEFTIPANPPQTQTFELASAAHDGWNYSPFNGTDWSNSDDESWPGSDADIWYWFDLSDIPQGATITEAYLRLTASVSKAGGGAPTIRAVAEDAAAVPANGADSVADVSNLTTAGVTWVWGAQTNGTQYSSPNIASVLQEIVDRPGWTGPVLLYGVHGGTDEQRVYAYENGPANANYRPDLVVTWQE